MKEILYIVVPCYNETEVLPESSRILWETLHSMIESEKISSQSRILFVNDGSKDGTLDLLLQLHKADKLFSCVDLARNVGHQNALLAGLMAAREKADITISIDADLQDDVNAIEKMVDKHLETQCDIVYGVRQSRASDSFLKRFTAQTFYKFMRFMGSNSIYNHADCRLMTRRALDALAEYKEQNLYLRGIIPTFGFPSAVVTYDRCPRNAGESKYSLKKMVNLASDGITSAGVLPIRLVTCLGAVFILLGVLLLVFSIIGCCMGYTMLNWKIITLSIWIVGGLILLGVGIVGEYVGKILTETKGRPKYTVQSIYHKD